LATYPAWGACVEGAGIHHNPTPGQAGTKFLYAHSWVSLAAVGKHPTWGAIALPLQADLYVRRKDLPKIAPEYHWTFRTKLELSAHLLAQRVPGEKRSMVPVGG